MSHDRLKELVFLSTDGELNPAERAETEKHLSECTECRSALAVWQKTAAVLFTPAQCASSDKFVDAVMRRIKSEPPAGIVNRLRGIVAGWREAFPFPRLALAGAGTAAMIVSVFFFTQSTHTVNMSEDEATFVSDLLEGPIPSADNDNADLGTAIEDYFL